MSRGGNGWNTQGYKGYGRGGGGASDTSNVNPAVLSKQLGLTSMLRGAERRHTVEERSRTLGANGANGSNGANGRGFAADAKALERRRHLIASTKRSTTTRPCGGGASPVAHPAKRRKVMCLPPSAARKRISGGSKDESPEAGAKSPAEDDHPFGPSSAPTSLPTSLPTSPSSPCPRPPSEDGIGDAAVPVAPAAQPVVTVADIVMGRYRPRTPSTLPSANSTGNAATKPFSYFPTPSCMAEFIGNQGARNTIAAWMAPRPHDAGAPPPMRTPSPPTKRRRRSSALTSAAASGHGILILYGPPGVGKTLALHLMAAERGYSVTDYDPSNYTNLYDLFDSLSMALNQSKTIVVVDPFEGMPHFTDRSCERATAPKDIGDALRKLHEDAADRPARLVFVVSSDRCPTWHTARHSLPKNAQVRMYPLSEKQLTLRFYTLRKKIPSLHSISGDRIAQYAAIASGDMRKFESFLWMQSVFDANNLPTPPLDRFAACERILSPYLPLDNRIAAIEDAITKEELQTMSMTYENYPDTFGDDPHALDAVVDAADRMSLADTLSPDGFSGVGGGGVAQCRTLHHLLFHTAPHTAAFHADVPMQPVRPQYGALAAHVYELHGLAEKRRKQRNLIIDMQRAPSSHSTAEQLEAHGLTLSTPFKF